MSKKRLVALVLAPALLFATNVFACEGKTVVFEDDFKDDSGGWDLDKAMRFGASGLSVEISSTGTIFKELNSAFVIKDGDLCLEAAFPAKAQNEPTVGVKFWAVDYQNFFLFQVSQTGKASLWRQTAGKWAQIHEAEVPGIKKDPGASNLLRVTLKGNLISVHVNGQKIRDQRGQAPTADARFGFYFQIAQPVAAAEARTFRAIRYKVTDVP